MCSPTEARRRQRWRPRRRRYKPVVSAIRMAYLIGIITAVRSRSHRRAHLICRMALVQATALEGRTVAREWWLARALAAGSLPAKVPAFPARAARYGKAASVTLMS